MKNNLKALLLSTVFVAAASVAAGSVAAQAGDLMPSYGGLKDGGYSAPAPILQPMGGSLKDAPMAAPAQTGWYIRGDIGYSHYGNTDGYIGEHEMYVGENNISSTGTMVGDFDGSCNLNGNGDYQYVDRGYVFDDTGDIQVEDANGDVSYQSATVLEADAARVQAERAAAEAAAAAAGTEPDYSGIAPAYTAITNYKNDDGSSIAADGYTYWNDASTGKPVVRYNPAARTDAASDGIPVLDENGSPIEYRNADGTVMDYATTIANGAINPIAIEQPDGSIIYARSVTGAGDAVDGNNAGLWEVYNKGADKWSNLAAVYHDNAGAQKVMLWDTNSWVWSDRTTDGTNFVTDDLLNAVKTFAATIPARFLTDSASSATEGRESAWLREAVQAAGRSTCNIGRNALTAVDIDDTWTLGGGVGYNFSSHWRGDLTFDYRFGSDVTARADHLDAWGTTSLTATRHTELSSFVALANLYYDFGDRQGFTPYIGAGIGFSVNRLADYTQGCYDNSTGMGCMKTQSGNGDSNTDVAAAAMVGFTQNLGRNLKLDVGYRYLYMGDAQTGNELAAADAGGQGQLVLEDLTAHEIRVGLRYDFGCGTCR